MSFGKMLLMFLKDKPAPPSRTTKSSYRNTSPQFKHYLHSAGIFALAYFSFGFLLLKAYTVGFEIKQVALLYALVNVAFVIFAPFIGKLGDVIGRKKIIISQYVLYVVMCVGFIFASTKGQVLSLFIIFGIFYSIDESQSKAYIADLEKKNRATAMGIYNFTLGLIYLPASLIAGFLWKLDPNYAFLFAGCVSLLALIYFLFRK